MAHHDCAKTEARVTAEVMNPASGWDADSDRDSKLKQSGACRSIARKGGGRG